MSKDMEVKQCLSVLEAAELLGLSVRVACELLDPNNFEPDLLGKPLGVWIKEDLVEEICRMRRKTFYDTDPR